MDAGQRSQVGDGGFHECGLLRWLLGLLILAGWSTVSAADWTRFRGPNGTGVADDAKATPETWSPDENVKWKAALPGAGVSSPIVVGDRVFVTCYSGYGIDRENPGQIENLKRHLVCLNVGSGKIAWEKTVDAVLPEDPYSGAGIPAHGYASHTPVSDGERVYVFFGKTGVLAFDMDGNQLWQKSVGTESDPREWGSSSSPILYENLLIVTAAPESQSLVGLDKLTGEEVWRQAAASLDNMWGTPALIDVDGRTDLVMVIPQEMWGLNPENGKLRWFAEATNSDQSQASVVVDDKEGVLYAVTGRNGGSVAIKAGGKGDVTSSHTLWAGSDSGSFGSPVLHDGRLYAISRDIVSVIDAESGEKVTQARLSGGSGPAASEGGGDGGSGRGPREEADQARRGAGGNRNQEREGFGGGQRGEGQRGEGGRSGFGGGGRGGGGGFGGRSMDFASPVIADGKLYYVKGNGDTFVYQLGDELEQVAVNKVTADSESFGGTPAVSDGRLFLRSDKHLYCVAAE